MSNPPRTVSTTTNHNSNNNTNKNDRNIQIASLAAGMSSGSIASILCAPLDLVKTRLQVQGAIRPSSSSAAATTISNSSYSMSFSQMFVDILRHDGIRGCFRGLTPTLACVPIFWGLYFPMYEYAKPMYSSLLLSSNYHHHHHINHTPSSHNYRSDNDDDDDNTNNESSFHHHLVHLASAITAGAIADVLVNPMFLVRTRMQTESLHHFVEHKFMPKLTMRQTIGSLYREGNGNLLIFWRGLTASMLGLSHVGIQFPVYEYLKAKARRRNAAQNSSTNDKKSQESALDLLVASGISKLVACAITYPHEVVRSRMMDLRGETGMGMVSTVKLILREESWPGLYRGLHVSLIRVVPNCCLTFISYELILRYVKQNLLQVDEDPR